MQSVPRLSKAETSHTNLKTHFENGLERRIYGSLEVGDLALDLMARDYVAEDVFWQGFDTGGQLSKACLQRSLCRGTHDGRISQGKEDCDSPGTIDYVRSVILCPRQGKVQGTLDVERTLVGSGS